MNNFTEDALPKKRLSPICNLLLHVWQYSAGNRGKVVVFVVLSLLANLTALANPLLIGRIFNDVQFQSRDDRLLHQVVVNLLLLLVLQLVFWIFHGTSRVLERSNAFFAKKRYKQELLSQVLDLPAAWHKDHHSGDTIDKVNKASDSLFGFADQVFQIVQNMVGLVGSIIILLFFDWRAALVAVACSFVAISAMVRFDERLKRGYATLYKKENLLAAAIHDYVSNILTIITLQLKPRVEREVERRSLEPFRIFKQNTVINEVKWFSTSFLITLMTVAVLIWNAYHSYAVSGVIMIGTLFTLYRYLQSVGDTFYTFASMYGNYIQQDTALQAAESIKLEHQKLAPRRETGIPGDWRELAVEGLSFTYDNSPAVHVAAGRLHDICLRIRRGSRIAFVGESGSGKSTTLSLLRGLYEPLSARVLCDGKELEYGLEHLRDTIMLIPQDPELFNSTIEDNITMDLDCSPEELELAVGLARFDGVLKRLKLGLKTNVLEKGVSLSGGEKQRLALARGILAAKGSDIILLDEPTSSVDPVNERKIYEHVFEHFRNRTIISTVHRLHLLSHFDYIYVFSRGGIEAEGSLPELMRHEGFKKLWQQYHANMQAAAA